MFKYSLIFAAVLALNSVRPLSASAADGWPVFKDIDLETARGIAVPTAEPASAKALKISAIVSPLYAFELPVENTAGLGYPITAAGKTRDLVVTVVRKDYGYYEASLEVSGATDSFKVLKLARGRYLVRGGEVNLMAVPDEAGSYLDISGTIPLPSTDTLKFRLKISTDGTLVSEEPGRRLALRQDQATGELDLKVFSKADAACLIALGLAMTSDRLATDPLWAPPPEPGPWVRVPYKPAPNGLNPWGQRPGSGYPAGGAIGIGGGGGSGSGGKSAGAKKNPGSSGGWSGGGSGGGGGRGGGGGGFGRDSSGSFGGGGGRGSGGSKGQFSNSRGGGRTPGEARGGRQNGPAGGAGRAATKKADTNAAGGRKSARADKPKPAAAGKKTAAGRKKLPGRRPEDSRSLARNVTNSLGGGKPRPFTEPKPAEVKTTQTVKAGSPAPKTPKQKPLLTAGAFTKADKKLRSLGALKNPQYATAAVLPRPELRDSLNDGPARNQPAQAAAEAKRSKRVPAVLAGTVTALTKTAAALANTVAAAVTSLGAAVNSVLTWLKTLI